MSRSISITSWSGALLFGGTGLVLVIGGLKLAVLGGSLYYVLAGTALAITGLLLKRGSRLAVWVFTGCILATIIWALVEVGLDAWGLLPRIATFAVLALWFVIPAVRRSLVRGPSPSVGTHGVLNVLVFSSLLPWLLIVVSLYLAHSVASVPAASVSTSIRITRDNDWHLYGNTARGDRFSPADQITRSNVQKLVRAWTFRTGDIPTDGDVSARVVMFEATPIKVGSALFFCTPRNVLFSIDADTGKELWHFDPFRKTIHDEGMSFDRPRPLWPRCRGVSYHTDNGTSEFCDGRILMATGDNRLLALDVATGNRCPGFGNDGVVDLTVGMGDNPPGYYYTTSPPVIIGHAAVIGASHLDNQTNDEPPGVVRAFDARSGALLWAWEVLEPTSRRSLAPGETYARNTANAWTIFSADVENGLVFVPTGVPPPDYFGGQRRPAQERYSNSIVALDVKSGTVRWSFQTVHHDLWDLDNASQPVVVDLELPSGRREALIAPTKRGEVFILDRLTGKPIFGVENRSVPQNPAPGEWLSPTQPYPIGFPSFSPPRLKEADMWGATMFDQLLCRIEFRSRRYEGQFTPPSLKGSIGYPDVFGVFNWGSVAVDPERQLMFVNPTWLPHVTQLISRAQADQYGIVPMGEGSSKIATARLHAKTYAQAGTPYAVSTRPFLSPLGFPCHRPPWGAVAVVDLRNQRILWQKPFGTTRDAAPLGLPLPVGVFSLGGAVVTRGGIAFIGAAIDNYLRAFDLATGHELWRARLPAGGQATPMTYMSERTGRQYVVIAAGGHAAMKTQQGDFVVAYALPNS